MEASFKKQAVVHLPLSPITSLKIPPIAKKTIRKAHAKGQLHVSPNVQLNIPVNGQLNAQVNVQSNGQFTCSKRIVHCVSPMTSKREDAMRRKRDDENVKKDQMVIRKLDFGMEMEDGELLTIRLLPDQNRKIIRTEVKLEDSSRLIPSNLPSSRLSLHSFNSFLLTPSRQLLDLLDPPTQQQQQDHFLEEHRKKQLEKGLENSSQELERRTCCNCKKSRCLKLYCECFAAQKLCGGCNCLNCANLEGNEEEREEVIRNLVGRNPSAFKPKLEVKDKELNVNWNGLDIGLKHTKGCNCKKTNCQKKYCECFQAGIRCGELCKCEECKNNCCEEQEEMKMEFPNFLNGGGKRLKLNLFNSLEEEALKLEV